MPKIPTKPSVCPHCKHRYYLPCDDKRKVKCGNWRMKNENSRSAVQQGKRRAVAK
jgi:hypothetical protein